MRKKVTLQVVIFVAILAIVLPLVFLAIPLTVAEFTMIASNGYKFLSFDLKKGQTVQGFYHITGSNKTYCYILTPNGDEVSASPSYYRFEYGTDTTFSFQADMDGQYSLCISGIPSWMHHIKYSYSISSPPILGLDPIILIGLVIAIGVILELTVFLRYNVKSRKFQISTMVEKRVSYVF